MKILNTEQIEKNSEKSNRFTNVVEGCNNKEPFSAQNLMFVLYAFIFRRYWDDAEPKLISSFTSSAAACFLTNY